MRNFFTHTDPVVPAFHPRVLVETAVAQGADRLAVFAGTGLRPEMLDRPETRISYADFTQLVENGLRLTGNPGLGLDAGARCHVSSMGLLGLAVMSSANAGEALATLLRNWQTISPCFQGGLRFDRGCATLQLKPTIRLPRLDFAIEMVLAAFDVQTRFMLGRKPPVLALRIGHPELPHCREYIDMHYGASASFGHDLTEIDFDPQVLSWPTIFAEPNTAKLAERVYVQHAGPAETEQGLVAQVERILESSGGPMPDLEEVARRLRTSARTLRRTLTSMGTSFRSLRDGCLQRRALDLTLSTDMTFEQMAGHLGFSDVRSFRRAFKRWTGELPTQVRNRARASADGAARPSAPQTRSPAADQAPAPSN